MRESINSVTKQLPLKQEIFEIYFQFGLTFDFYIIHFLFFFFQKRNHDFFNKQTLKNLRVSQFNDKIMFFSLIVLIKSYILIKINQKFTKFQIKILASELKA